MLNRAIIRWWRSISSAQVRQNASRSVTAPEKVLVEKEDLMEYLEKEPVDVLVTFGAGNIDRFIGPIADLLGKR